jgi:hypothetical protein
VMKALEKDRARRYETANGLAADLKRHLTNEPVVARPPSTGYKLQKAWRRNKLVFATGCGRGGGTSDRECGGLVAGWSCRRNCQEAGSDLYLTRLAAAHQELTAEPPNIQQAEALLEACKPRCVTGNGAILKGCGSSIRSCFVIREKTGSTAGIQPRWPLHRLGRSRWQP